MHRTRHLRAIKPFISKWLDKDCVIQDTSLSELARNADEAFELSDGDLRY